MARRALPYADLALAIGISESQLRLELPGRSLIDVSGHQVDPQSIADVLRSADVVFIDQALQSGELSADVADQMKANLDSMIQVELNQIVPADPPGLTRNREDRARLQLMGRARVRLTLQPVASACRAPVDIACASAAPGGPGPARLH